MGFVNLLFATQWAILTSIEKILKNVQIFQRRISTLKFQINVNISKVFIGGVKKKEKR